MRLVSTCFALLAVAVFASSASAGDWPAFRGPDGTAVSEAKNLPTKWSETENFVWKTAMPGPGSSSPIIVGAKVIVTCYSGYGVDRRKPGEVDALARRVVCLSLADGKILWDKSFPATVAEDPFEGMMLEHGYASSTPAADKDGIYCFFGKSGVIALDWNGAERWRQSVGTNSAIMNFGSGASLLLYNNLVVVNANAESESIVAFDKATGKQAWKAPAEGYEGSWSTPVVVNAGGKKELVVYMRGEVWALGPEDGKLNWYATGVGGSPVTTVASKDDVVFAVGGGPAGSAATAIRAGGKKDVTESNILWKKNFGTYVPSPVVLNDRLYWVDDDGTAYCLNATTGEQVFRKRLSARGGVYASLVAGDGKLYAATRTAGVVVLKPGDTFEELAVNKFAGDDTDFNATPALTDGKIVLRSNQAVYCVGTK